MIKGIDVSSYQSPTWSTAGLDFVFIKSTEGHTLTDSAQAKHAARARAAGLVVGFYHFLWPGNIDDQAQYFVSKCASVEGDILAVDWETTSSGTHASCAEKDQFIRAVKALRPTHKVVLYTSTNAWKTWDTTSYAGDGLWIAQYNGSAGHPAIQAPWLFDQWDDKPLDEDVANFPSRAAMKAWATGSKVPAKPVVDLSNVVAAAKSDPKAAQGHTTHAADVKLVEAALKAEKLLSAKYASDGSFGTTTVAAYAKWQKKLGYKGSDADGIPGKASLTALGKKHGFTVKA